MAKGDYTGQELTAMAARANDPTTHPSVKAFDALRALPQLTPTDLQQCIAFRLDPFSFLAAKLEESERIAAERADRIASIEMREREARQREAWGQETIDASVGLAATPDPALGSAMTLAAEARQLADEKSISIAEAMSRVTGRAKRDAAPT